MDAHLKSVQKTGHRVLLHVAVVFRAIMQPEARVVCSAVGLLKQE